MKKYFLLFIFLLFTSCSKSIPCKYKVGDKVRTITGDIFVVKTIAEGAKGTLSNYEPSYILTVGPGWRINTNIKEIKFSRGTYFVLESEIVEKIN